jgi:hypothetical protein
MPWANPANIAFNDQAGTMLVTNHASLVPFDLKLFVVFDVFVNDKGQPLPWQTPIPNGRRRHPSCECGQIGKGVILTMQDHHCRLDDNGGRRLRAGAFPPDSRSED